MKSITNKSLQSFEVYLKYPKKSVCIHLEPKMTIVVPSSALTDQCLTLSKRHLLKIRSV
jgi:HKD family nuclease